ncbi:hypothetical protein FHT21_002945 [Pedobacter sp. SG908]|nr:hypothetical protein [Pedobacter sp. SG908]NMN37774.1 hypothetical protein [Pedobacter sp. SG918]
MEKDCFGSAYLAPCPIAIRDDYGNELTTINRLTGITLKLKVDCFPKSTDIIQTSAQNLSPYNFVSILLIFISWKKEF